MQRDERVILVSPADEELGSAEKLEAHVSGALHRAFSVFVLNSRGEILLQRRASSKYHSGGLWSNTCCGHPRPGEDTDVAALRRLREEMGFACDLRHLFTFSYRADLDQGLSEHEIDHVFVGVYDGEPAPNPGEVAEWRWVRPGTLRAELTRAPDRFTRWLAPALDGLLRRQPEPGVAAAG